jgi:mycofactocin precursor
MTAAAPEAPAVEVRPSADETTVADETVLADVLVEEISIDGMCGVY